MKKLIGAAALFLLTSCGFVQDELYRSGGFVGAQADRFLPAQTPQQRFDRYMIIAMILAPTALETAIDEEEAAATIRRINALYHSLAELRKSLICEGGNTQSDSAFQPSAQGVDPRRSGTDIVTNRSIVVCDGLQGRSEEIWGDYQNGLASNGYSFEHLEYEVQQDLFFVARAVVTNLDLDTDVGKLLNLNALTLAKLWTKVDELLPMFRETAARFRGGIILYADISQASCLPEANSACQRLRSLMAARFRGVPNNSQIEGRDIKRMLDLAQIVFDGEFWGLNTAQYMAVIQQIDHSCRVAYHRQTGPDGTPGDTTLPNCGASISSEVPASTERQVLIKAIDDIDFVPPAAISAEAQAQANAQAAAAAQALVAAEAQAAETARLQAQAEAASQIEAANEAQAAAEATAAQALESAAQANAQAQAAQEALAAANSSETPAQPSQ